MVDSTPPGDITVEMFRKWRVPIRGSLNPHPMTNPVWNWLIESGLTPHRASALFCEPSACSAGPGWCFGRYGQSCTTLPDGRSLWLAGEYEDYYDPDFFIYNDAVTISPDGDIQIFGYPANIFPPTDFHSATLVDGHIVLVGNLGYASDRRQGATQVLILGLDHWRLLPVRTEGLGPGWVHSHSARLEGDGRSLVISGGKVDRCDCPSLVENIDDWRLSLWDWKWERLTMRRWARFEVFRKDNSRIHLWSMRQTLWYKQYASESAWASKQAEKEERELQAQLGCPAKLDVLPLLYHPEVAHDELPEDPEAHGVHRIGVGAVVVRYVEDAYSIQVTVEGELPAEGVEQIRNDLIKKLEALEQSPMDYRVIPPA